MKKVIVIFLGILLMLLSDEGEVKHLVQASSEQTVVNKQLKVIAETKIPGYKFYASYPVKLTGKYVPEIAVSSYRYEGGLFNYTDQTLLQIYQFNSNTKKWSVIKSFVQNQDQYDFIYGPLQFITKGKLMDKNKEQLVVGYRWGSRHDLSPFVYGSTDGKTIKQLISTGDVSYRDGNAIIKNKELFFVQSLSIVENKYTYKSGKFIRSVGTGADDRKVAGNAKHMVMLEKTNNRINIIANNKMTVKVGDSLSVVRKNPKDSSTYSLQLYTDPSPYVKHSPIQNPGGFLKTVKTGKVTWSIVADYTVNKTININIVK